MHQSWRLLLLLLVLLLLLLLLASPETGVGPPRQPPGRWSAATAPGWLGHPGRQAHGLPQLPAVCPGALALS
jgi:hypothetical protein